MFGVSVRYCFDGPIPTFKSQEARFTTMSGGSQSSLSAGDEKFIPADDKQVTPAVNHIDEKARKSGRFKMDVVITGFSTLVYLMS